MLRSRFALPCLLTLIFAHGVFAHSTPSLNRIPYAAAGVLPIFVKKGTQYAVLSREAYGPDKGMYDSFAGSRDPHETDPTITAARECVEEMISHITLHISEAQMQRYIDQSKKNTTMVLAYPSFKYVLYITRFDKHINQFLRSFYPTLNKSNDHKYKEKDRIAVVAWHDLKQAIVQNKNQICADVYDPQTHKPFRCMITLRPIVIRCLKPLFRNDAYQVGKNKKIRFY